MESSPVSHLYVHIPFCPSKCAYCAFVTHIGSLKLLEPYLHALKLEAQQQAEEKSGGPLASVYFGGGTPTMAEPDAISGLLHTFASIWGLTDNCEVTLEGHPSTFDRRTLPGYVDAGVTRFSFGAESLQPVELRGLGRRHSSEDALHAIEWARQAGFSSINTDLMYGVPAQSVDSWHETLRQALEAAPDHLSLYPLSIEPKTVFARRRARGMLSVPNDDVVVEMYEAACAALSEAGYRHYEVANWAKPGHECRHNLAYWLNKDFYAIGVGVHGYLRPTRFQNIESTKRYIDTVCAGGSPRAESYRVSREQEASDTVMLQLRLLSSGVDVADMKARYDWDVIQRAGDRGRLMIDAGMLKLHEHKLVIAETSVPMANEIFLQFAG